MGDQKRTKSFSLKNENADKIEKVAFETNKRESHIVDELIEELDDGSR